MTTQTRMQRVFSRRNVFIACFVIAIAASFTLLARLEIVLVPLAAFCGGVYLRRRSRSHYITFVLWLFFLAPMLRRMIDAHMGSTSASAVIASPILACVASMPHVKRLWAMASFGRMKWFALVVATYAYAAFVGYMLHSPSQMIQELITWLGPLIFAFYIFEQREHIGEILEVFRDQFMIGTLVMGLYGIYQYAFLAPWDATWMEVSPMSTIGSPEPFAVRVFSTMNAPQTFADFITFGVLLSTASTRRLRFLAIPIGLAALGLSNSRSAWIGMVVGFCFIILFFPARRRMQIILALVGSAIFITIVSQIPEVNEQLTQRFQSFTDLKADSSVNARMLSQERAVTLFQDRAFGNGFGGSEDSGSAPTGGTATVQGVYLADNGIEQFMLTFGWFGSAVFAVALIGLIITCLRAPLPPEMITTNAALLALVVQLPTMGLFASAPAFLLWSIIMLGVATREKLSPSGLMTKPAMAEGTQVQTV